MEYVERQKVYKILEDLIDDVNDDVNDKSNAIEATIIKLDELNVIKEVV